MPKRRVENQQTNNSSKHTKSLRDVQFSVFKEIFQFEKIPVQDSKAVSQFVNVLSAYIASKLLWLDDVTSPDCNFQEGEVQQVREFLFAYSFRESFSRCSVDFSVSVGEFNIRSVIREHDEMKICRLVSKLASAILNAYRHFQVELPPLEFESLQALKQNVRKTEIFLNKLKMAFFWLERFSDYPSSFFSGVACLKQIKSFRLGEATNFDVINKVEVRLLQYYSLVRDYYVINFSFNDCKRRLEASLSLLRTDDKTTYPYLEKILNDSVESVVSFVACKVDSGLDDSTQTQDILHRVDTLLDNGEKRSLSISQLDRYLFDDSEPLPAAFPANGKEYFIYNNLLTYRQASSWLEKLCHAKNWEARSADDEQRPSGKHIRKIQDIALKKEVFEKATISINSLQSEVNEYTKDLKKHQTSLLANSLSKIESSISQMRGHFEEGTKRHLKGLNSVMDGMEDILQQRYKAFVFTPAQKRQKSIIYEKASDLKKKIAENESQVEKTASELLARFDAEKCRLYERMVTALNTEEDFPLMISSSSQYLTEDERTSLIGMAEKKLIERLEHEFLLLYDDSFPDSKAFAFIQNKIDSVYLPLVDFVFSSSEAAATTFRVLFRADDISQVLENVRERLSMGDLPSPIVSFLDRCEKNLVQRSQHKRRYLLMKEQVDNMLSRLSHSRSVLDNQYHSIRVRWEKTMGDADLYGTNVNLCYSQIIDEIKQTGSVSGFNSLQSEWNEFAKTNSHDIKLCGPLLRPSLDEIQQITDGVHQRRNDLNVSVQNMLDTFTKKMTVKRENLSQQFRRTGEQILTFLHEYFDAQHPQKVDIRKTFLTFFDTLSTTQIEHLRSAESGMYTQLGSGASRFLENALNAAVDYLERCPPSSFEDQEVMNKLFRTQTKLYRHSPEDVYLLLQHIAVQKVANAWRVAYAFFAEMPIVNNDPSQTEAFTTLGATFVTLVERLLREVETKRATNVEEKRLAEVEVRVQGLEETFKSKVAGATLRVQQLIKSKDLIAALEEAQKAETVIESLQSTLAQLLLQTPNLRLKERILGLSERVTCHIRDTTSVREITGLIDTQIRSESFIDNTVKMAGEIRALVSSVASRLKDLEQLWMIKLKDVGESDEPHSDHDTDALVADFLAAVEESAQTSLFWRHSEAWSKIEAEDAVIIDSLKRTNSKRFLNSLDKIASCRKEVLLLREKVIDNVTSKAETYKSALKKRAKNLDQSLEILANKAIDIMEGSDDATKAQHAKHREEFNEFEAFLSKNLHEISYFLPSSRLEILAQRLNVSSLSYVTQVLTRAFAILQRMPFDSFVGDDNPWNQLKTSGVLSLHPFDINILQVLKLPALPLLQAAYAYMQRLSDTSTASTLVACDHTGIANKTREIMDLVEANKNAIRTQSADRATDQRVQLSLSKCADQKDDLLLSVAKLKRHIAQKEFEEAINLSPIVQKEIVSLGELIDHLLSESVFDETTENIKKLKRELDLETKGEAISETDIWKAKQTHLRQLQQESDQQALAILTSTGKWLITAYKKDKTDVSHILQDRRYKTFVASLSDGPPTTPEVWRQFDDVIGKTLRELAQDDWPLQMVRRKSASLASQLKSAKDSSVVEPVRSHVAHLLSESRSLAVSIKQFFSLLQYFSPQNIVWWVEYERLVALLKNVHDVLDFFHKNPLAFRLEESSPELLFLTQISPRNRCGLDEAMIHFLEWRERLYRTNSFVCRFDAMEDSMKTQIGENTEALALELERFREQLVQQGRGGVEINSDTLDVVKVLLSKVQKAFRDITEKCLDPLSSLLADHQHIAEKKIWKEKSERMVKILQPALDEMATDLRGRINSEEQWIADFVEKHNESVLRARAALNKNDLVLKIEDQIKIEERERRTNLVPLLVNLKADILNLRVGSTIDDYINVMNTWFEKHRDGVHDISYNVAKISKNLCSYVAETIFNRPENRAVLKLKDAVHSHVARLDSYVEETSTISREFLELLNAPLPVRVGLTSSKDWASQGSHQAKKICEKITIFKNAGLTALWRKYPKDPLLRMLVSMTDTINDRCEVILEIMTACSRVRCVSERHFDFWTDAETLRILADCLAADRKVSKSIVQSVSALKQKVGKLSRINTETFVSSSNFHDGIIQQILQIEERQDTSQTTKRFYEEIALPLIENLEIKLEKVESILKFARRELISTRTLYMRTDRLVLSQNDEDEVKRYLEGVKHFCLENHNVHVFQPTLWDSVIDAYEELPNGIEVAFTSIEQDAAYLALFASKAVACEKPEVLTTNGKKKISAGVHCPCPFRFFSPLWHNSVAAVSEQGVCVTAVDKPIVSSLAQTRVHDTLRHMEWIKHNGPHHDWPLTTDEEVIANIVLALNIWSDWHTDDDFATSQQVMDVTGQTFMDIIELACFLLTKNEEENDADSVVSAIVTVLQIKCKERVSYLEEKYIFLNNEGFRKLSVPHEGHNNLTNWIKILTLVSSVFNRDLSTILSSFENLAHHKVATQSNGTVAKSLNSYILYKLHILLRNGETRRGILTLWEKTGMTDCSVKNHILRAYPTTWNVQRETDPTPSVVKYTPKETPHLPLTVFDVLISCLLFEIDCVICTNVARETWQILYRSVDFKDAIPTTAIRPSPTPPFSLDFPESVFSHLTDQLSSFDKDLFWMLQPQQSNARPQGSIVSQDKLAIIDVVFLERNQVDVVNCYELSKDISDIIPQPATPNSSQIKHLSDLYLVSGDRNKEYPLLSSIHARFQIRKEKRDDPLNPFISDSISEQQRRRQDVQPATDTPQSISMATSSTTIATTAAASTTSLSPTANDDNAAIVSIDAETELAPIPTTNNQVYKEEEEVVYEEGEEENSSNIHSSNSDEEARDKERLEQESDYTSARLTEERQGHTLYEGSIEEKDGDTEDINSLMALIKHLLITNTGS